MPRTSRLRLPVHTAEPLSHYWLRYPAKFHPPVAQELLRSYSEPGATVLDPFCGSGSLLVEARAMGRSSIGIDIDPVAVFCSRVKTRRYSIPAILSDVKRLFGALHNHRQDRSYYDGRKFDIGTEAEADRELHAQGLHAPAISNIYHWFRPYVVVDLARIAATINEVKVSSASKDLFRLAFASSIRASSNADPVPVSGLEVTAHMKRLDEGGRVVDPFSNFERRLSRIVETLWQLDALFDPRRRVSVHNHDATTLRQVVRRHVDAVITSPPYHNAVDYHRRHQLEMFWLEMVSSPAESLALRAKYIGKPVRVKHAFSDARESLPRLAANWHNKILEESRARARAFSHYCYAMQAVFRQLAGVLRPGSPAVFVVGHSRWNGYELPTSALFDELAGQAFKLDEQRWYPLQNRYMSYARRNDANISKEYVLAFRRTDAEA